MDFMEIRHGILIVNIEKLYGDVTINMIIMRSVKHIIIKFACKRLLHFSEVIKLVGFDDVDIDTLTIR